MRNLTIGIIDATPEFHYEGEDSLCSPLLQFAGNFRLIDFMLQF